MRDTAVFSYFDPLQPAVLRSAAVLLPHQTTAQPSQKLFISSLGSPIQPGWFLYNGAAPRRHGFATHATQSEGYHIAVTTMRVRTRLHAKSPPRTNTLGGPFPSFPSHPKTRGGGRIALHADQAENGDMSRAPSSTHTYIEPTTAESTTIALAAYILEWFDHRNLQMARNMRRTKTARQRASAARHWPPAQQEKKNPERGLIFWRPQSVID